METIAAPRMAAAIRESVGTKGGWSIELDGNDPVGLAFLRNRFMEDL